MHIVYMGEMYSVVCRENISYINVRVRKVKSSSKVGKK